jgi:putative PIN family toxin of toxin-antitoxin system
VQSELLNGRQKKKIDPADEPGCSGLHFGGKAAEVLDYALEERFLLITSPLIRHEVERTLAGRFGWVPQRIAVLEKTIWSVAQPVKATQIVEICRDPNDNHVLETCLACDANFLVCGDKDLLVLSSFQSTAIVTVQYFLAEKGRP